MPPHPATGRRGRSPAAAQVLAQMTAARAALDADAATRRRREDELLGEFAAAVGDAAAAVARRDRALADLQQRREAVVAAAAADTVAAEARQAAALAGLNRFRTAEEIGAVVGMNEKRVRAAIRTHRAAAGHNSHPVEAGGRGVNGASESSDHHEISTYPVERSADDEPQLEAPVPERSNDLPAQRSEGG